MLDAASNAVNSTELKQTNNCVSDKKVMYLKHE